MFPSSFGFVYKLFLLLHIMSIIVAFAPGFVWPFVSVRLKREGQDPGPAIGALAEGNSARIHGPAMILAGFFGFGLVALSKDAWEFSQAWVSAAMLLWFLALGVVFAVMAPAEKRAANGDQGASKIIAMAGGILHLLLTLLIIDMIWKPGL